MGNFYVNYTLRGPSQQSVASLLAGRAALVTHEESGCVVVFDEASEAQDQAVIAKLGARLSGELRCPVLAVLNHDDDILWYQLYLNGALADEYNSTPDYFDQSAADPSGPAGGDATKLCVAFGSNNIAAVETILRKSDYPFAFERHAALAEALGIPEFGVGVGYEYIQSGEWPEDLTEADLVNTKDLVATSPASEASQKVVPGYYKVRIHAAGSVTPSAEANPAGWMPQLWAELDCPESELTAEFQKVTARYREQFNKLGFKEMGFKKLSRVLNPSSRDGGAVHYLDPSHRFIGHLVYIKYYLTAQKTDLNTIVVAFTAVFPQKILSWTNQMISPLENPPDYEVNRLKTEDVAALYQKFTQHIGSTPETPRVFANPAALHAWFDANAIELLEHRVRAGRFVRMTNYEVEVAKSKIPPPIPNA